jgi:hypothetical protein
MVTFDGDKVSRMYIKDTIYANNMTVTGNFTFGNAAVDTLIINGRIASVSIAGAAIDIGATYTYEEGQEMRYAVSSWTGKSAFKASYLRASNDVTGSGKDIYGMELYGVANNVTTGQTTGLLAWAYAKGATAKTVGPMYAVHGELTFDASSATNTITTEATPALFKITGGVCDSYTKIQGMIIRAGDMDGASRTYGSGILMEDDSAMAGTITWTTGLNITSACTTGISLSGTLTTGISVGAATTGIAITGANTNGLSITGISSERGIKMQYSSLKTSGDVIGQQNRVRIGATGTATVYGYQGQTGVLDTFNCTGVYDIYSNPIMKGTTGTGTISSHFNAINAKLETEAVGAASSGTVTGVASCLHLENQMSGGTTTNGGVYPIYIEMNGDTKAWTADIRLSAGPTISSGAGAPSASLPKGSLYLRTNGSGVADRAYINTDGAGTWTAISTAG